MQTEIAQNQPTSKRKAAPDNRPKEAPRGGPYWVVRRMHFKDAPHHGPMFRHASEHSAITEAGRLASKFPGVTFAVLSHVATVKAVAPGVVEVTPAKSIDS